MNVSSNGHDSYGGQIHHANIVKQDNQEQIKVRSANRCPHGNGDRCNGDGRLVVFHTEAGKQSCRSIFCGFVAPESSTSCPFSRERSTCSSTCSATSFQTLPGVSVGSRSSRSPPSKEARQCSHGPATRAGRRERSGNIIFRVRFKKREKRSAASIDSCNELSYVICSDSQLTSTLSSFVPRRPWRIGRSGKCATRCS